LMPAATLHGCRTRFRMWAAEQTVLLAYEIWTDTEKACRLPQAV
jgi:hypothetical protein